MENGASELVNPAPIPDSRLFPVERAEDDDKTCTIATRYGEYIEKVNR